MLRNAEMLAEEYRAMVHERAPLVLARVRGARAGLDLTARATGEPIDFRWLWMLNAQIGSIEKLLEFLPEGRTPSTHELLMIARNLFENIIWLRLFEQDSDYGLIFYAQLLKQQREDAEAMIVKIKAEAALFHEMEKEDRRIIPEVFEGFGTSGRDKDEELAELMVEQQRRVAEVDRRVRREFILYAAAAEMNGYHYQAHLIEEQHLPKHREQLARIAALDAEFETLIGDVERLKSLRLRWNWLEQAKKVGMEAQYRFLYAWTSRLLHSTPMNLITEKQLLAPEEIMLLDYIVVTASDMLDAAERFDFPGRLNLAFFDLGESDSPNQADPASQSGHAKGGA
jgi:hypothetical protein